MKRISVAVIAVLATLSLGGCGQGKRPETAAPSHPIQPPVVEVSAADMGRVCRAAIASIMGRDANIIAVTTTSGNLIQTKYTRADGEVWQNQCRVEGNRVVWSTLNMDAPNSGPGRWRDEDEILFRIDGENIWIRQSSGGELISENSFVVH